MSVDSGTQTLEEGTTAGAEPFTTSVGDQVSKILEEGWNPRPKDEPGKAPPDSAEQPGKAPLDWKAIAERLQVDQSELYSLKVKTGDGQDVSIEDLKAGHKAQAEIDRLRGEVTKARGELEADRIRNQREIGEWLQTLKPEHRSPELQALMEKQKGEYLSREREAMLRTIPEWADTAVLAADRKAMLDTLSEYGATEADLENVTDHRLLRIFRDFTQLKQKAKAAETPPPVKVAVAPKKAQGQTEAQKLGHLKAAVTNRQMTQGEAVERILRGL